MYLVREVQINHLLLTQAREDQVIQYQIVHDMVRWCNMCKTPNQNIVFLFNNRLSKYCSKATAKWNSGLPAFILACIHTGLLLTLQRAGFIFVEVMKLNGMCYIYHLQQTLERNSGKKRWDGMFGDQDMPKQFLSFVHQESCVHTLVWQISSFLTRLFILSMLYRQWKNASHDQRTNST